MEIIVCDRFENVIALSAVKYENLNKENKT